MSEHDSSIFTTYPPSSEVDELPLLVSVSHCGIDLPEGLADRFASDVVRQLPDTDFHLERLYNFVPSLGARMVCARYSRYLVDLNRPADGHSLYPGRHETGLVPVTDFAGTSIYGAGEEPGEQERQVRVERYWRPYHEHIEAELSLMRARFGYALLFDAHSIRSVVPKFSTDALPELMLGDVGGTSAADALTQAVLDVHRDSGRSWRHNTPFQGGWITRCFGRPEDHVHALQLEMSQRLYMNESPPYPWNEELAAALRPVLRNTLLAYVGAAQRLYGA